MQIAQARWQDQYYSKKEEKLSLTKFLFLLY